MGKTASGAVWLDPNKTSPFDFYQYWRNVEDADVLNCIRMLTFLPMDEIESMSHWEGSQLNKAKEILAFELTKLVHGVEEAEKAQQSAQALFGSGSEGDIPTTGLSSDVLRDGQADILTLLVSSGLVTTRSDARRAVEQGGVSADGEKVADIRTSFSAEKLQEGVVLRRGKKNYMKVQLVK